jgi:hypothetical protein
MTKAMIKRLTAISSFLFLICILLGGCKKPYDDTYDEPEITVMNPVEGVTYNGSLTMSFSLLSISGLESCSITLKTNAGQVLYYNSFGSGAAVRGKTSFDFSEVQTYFPNTLTDAQCIVTAVNLNKTSAIKTINIKVKQ